MANPNRKSVIAQNKPRPCTECENKICLKTGAPCETVEKWVSQDYVSQAGLQLGVAAASYGDSFEHVDLFNFYNRKEIEPDNETSHAAWEKVKTLRLKPKHMEILDLFYRQGKRVCECAVELGTSDQVASARRIAAEKEIADRLERNEYYNKFKDFEFEIYKYNIIFELFFKWLFSRNEIARLFSVRGTVVSRWILKMKKILEG